jgi:Na+/H+ antiporter NhaC
VLPIALTLTVVMILLYVTGRNGYLADTGTEPQALRDVLKFAQSSLSLQYGALAGLGLAVALAQVQNLMSTTAIADAVAQGVRVVFPAILILWSAGAMSRMTGNKSVEDVATQTAYEFKDHRLYTGDFLKQQVLDEDHSEQGQDSAALARTVKLLPTAVFLLAAVLSFSTGTSFGTMGILMPMVVTLTHSVLVAQQGSVTADSPILLACVGSVLAGAIFGDHCSPISDTTILSSQSCGCDHIAHVVTQLPYALSVAAVGVVCGTLPVGWGISIWLLLPLQLVGILAILLLVGTRVENQTSD